MYAARSSTAASTIASNQIIVDHVLPACAARSKRSPAIVARPCSCHLCHARLEYNAINPVHDPIHHVVTQNLHIHAMKMMFPALLVPSSSRGSACAAQVQSRMFDVVRLLSLAARLAEGFCRAAITSVAKCVIYQEIARIARRLVVNRSPSAGIHARRNGEGRSSASSLLLFILLICFL